MRTSDMRKEARKVGLVKIHHFFVFPFSFRSPSLSASFNVFTCCICIFNWCCFFHFASTEQGTDRVRREKRSRGRRNLLLHQLEREKGKCKCKCLRMLATEEATSGHIYLWFYIQRIRSSEWSDCSHRWNNARHGEPAREVCWFNWRVLSLTVIIWMVWPGHLLAVHRSQCNCKTPGCTGPRWVSRPLTNETRQRAGKQSSLVR